jgi:hypothetical protein
MRARALIPVARALSKGRPPAEPSARSAISRAYYAAFGELMAYIEPRGYKGAGSRSPHDRAWRYLGTGIPDSDRRRQEERRALAEVGFRLKARRLKADYRLASTLSRNEAAIAVEEATRIRDGFDALDAALPSS